MADENIYTRCVVVKVRHASKDPTLARLLLSGFPFPSLPPPALVVKTIAQVG